MEFFQEPTFTAFLALVLSLVVLKIVSFAVSNTTTTDGNCVLRSVNAGIVAKDGTAAPRRPKVNTSKIKKRVKFVADVQVRNIDRYEIESENLENSDAFGSVSEVTVEEKSLKTAEKIDPFVDNGLDEVSGLKISNEKCFDFGEVYDPHALDKGSEKNEILVEKKIEDYVLCGSVEVKNEALVTSGMDSLNFEGQKDDVELKRTDEVIDQEGGYGEGGYSEKEGFVIKDSFNCEIQKDDVILTGNDEMSDEKNGNEKEGYGENEGFIGMDNENFEMQKDGVVFKGNDEMIDQKEGVGKEGCGENEEFVGEQGEKEEKVRDESMDSEDDGWEGIERSQLEKDFAEAVNFVEFGGKGKEKESDQLAKMGSDVQVQLYGLHKVAVEGPCHEPQPMTLKVAARAKWNAWQQLGSMNRELAMEQYIRLVSDNVPGWMHGFSPEESGSKFEGADNSGSQLIFFPDSERNMELNASDKSDLITGRKPVEEANIE